VILFAAAALGATLASGTGGTPGSGTSAALVSGTSAVLASGTGGAPCKLSFGRIDPLSWSGRSGQGYDPLDPVERWQEGRIYVQHDGAACTFIATVAAAGDAGERQAISAAEAPLHYRLTASDGRPLQDLALGAGSGLLQGSFGQGPGWVALRYRISLPAGQPNEAGTYREAVPLHLFLGDTTHATEVGTGLLAVSVPVQASLDLELDGLPGGGRDLDLGDLTVGATRSIAVRVRGNARYRVAVLSQNGGALVPDAAENGAVLPYRLEIAGGTAAAAGGAALLLHGAPRVSGTDYTLNVVVPAGAWTATGTFRDTVVISIEAE
jgi:hypothetical protein